jgi:hypothetical protein
MTRRMFAHAVSIVVLAALAACSAGTGAPAHTTKATGLFADKGDAAIDGALNRPPPKRLADLPVNTPVTVLSDEYGKDYYACRVRTADGRIGWVLCDSLSSTEH